MKRLRRKIYEVSKNIGDRIGIDLPYFVENGFWAVFGQMFVMLTGLLITVGFARLTEQEIYGQYQFVLSVFTLISIVSVPGLNVSVAQSTAGGYDGTYKRSVGFSFRWSLAGIPVIGAVAAYYFFAEKDTGIAFALVAGALFFPLFYAPNTWKAFYRGKSMFEQTAKNLVLQNAVLTAGLIGVLFLFPEELWLIIAIYFVAGASFNLLFYKRSLRFSENQKQDPDSLKYGLFITKIRIAGRLVNHFDKIIIGFFDIELLAVYMIAYKFLEIIRSLIKTVLQTAFPKFVQSRVSIKNKQLAVLATAGLLLAALLFLLAEPVIELLYTEKYSDAADVFRLLVWLLVFSFINPLLSIKLNAEKKRRKIFRLNVLAPLISIFASLGVLFLTEDFIWFAFAKLLLLQIFSFIFSRY